MKAKKLLSVIIAGLMVLSATAFTASAEEEVIDETEVAVEETAAEEEATVEGEATAEEEATVEGEATAEEETPDEEEVTAELTAVGLPEAVNGVITLTEDVTLEEKLDLTSDVTIDLGDNTLTLKKDNNTFGKGNYTIKNGTIEIAEGIVSSECIIRVGGYSPYTASLTLEGVTVEATNYSAACGLLGVYDTNKLVIKDSTIIAGTNTNTNGISVIYGNIQQGKLEISNTNITAEDQNQLIYGTADTDIDGLTFEGKIREFLFSVVGATVKNSTFTYTNAEGETTRAILRDAGQNRVIVFKNTTVSNVPTCTEPVINIKGASSAVYADSSSNLGTTENVSPFAVSIDGAEYATLAEAIGAVENGGVIVLKGNVTLTNNILVTVDKAFTLDTNGKKLACEGGRIFLYSGADMTIVGDGEISADLSKGSQTAIEVLDENSVLTIASASVSAGANNMIFAAGNGGSIVVNGGKYTATNGGTCFYIFDNAKLTINDGTFAGVGDKGTGVVWAFNGASVEVYGGKFDVENQPGSDFEISSDVNWILCDYRGLIGFPFTASLAVDSKGNVSVYGGTFNVNPTKIPNLAFGSNCLTTLNVDYVAEGYCAKANEDGTYTVTVAEAKIIDTASTTGAVVTLEDLNKNDSIDASVDATYKVVVESAPANDVKAANDAIKANAEDTNDSKAIFDISVVKVDSNGTETDLGGTSAGSVQNQKVTITLGETPKADSVKAYHVDENGAVAKINDITVDGKEVSFIAPSFSTYAFTYTAVALADDSATKNIGVAFERVADTSEYNIVLKSLDAGKVINRFMSTDLTFKLDVTSGAVDYSITPAANVNLVDNNNGRYEFNIDGLVLSGVTAEEITIGSVVFDGYGAIKFGVKTADTNIVNTAVVGTNIVETFTTGGDGSTTGKLVLNDDVPDDEGTIDVTFKAPTKNLTINVAYNNKIENQKVDYQAMTITVNGGDLTAPIVKKLGSDNTAEVTYDSANSVYTVEIADTLTQNTAYTVVVEGQGYRTARYTVTMNANKTLNFWNDVKVSEEQVEEGNDASKSFVNFLAGEIVKDGQINLYDLSAVVSYFGTLNNVNAESAFAKYDLNRDGKIDSRDVAYVLVSWGK